MCWVRVFDIAQDRKGVCLTLTLTLLLMVGPLVREYVVERAILYNGHPAAVHSLGGEGQHAQTWIEVHRGHGGGCPVPVSGLEGCQLKFRVRGIDFWGTLGAWSKVMVDPNPDPNPNPNPNISEVGTVDVPHEMSAPDAPFDITTSNIKDKEITVAWEVPINKSGLTVIGYRIVMQVNNEGPSSP